MVNTQALKDRLREKNLTQADLAKSLSIKPATTCQKLNNVRPFTLDEVEITANVLDITDDCLGHYFFSRELHSATN